MKTLLISLLLPLLTWAQEFQFVPERDSIPVQVGNYDVPAPWTGGYVRSSPDFCDIDGDGDYDLMLGDDSGRISFWQNQGTGLQADFSLATENYLQAVSEYYSRPEFWDMDGDNDLDLFLAYYTNPRISVFRNIGTFTQAQYELITDTLLDVTGQRIYCQRAALADLDGDGDKDLLCGENPGYLFYYENTGSSTAYQFTRVPGNFDNIDVGWAASPCFYDIDHDGDYDLFIGNKTGQIWYYQNIGTPQQYNFTLISNNWLGLDVGDYAAPEFCDLDGDGDYDLFLGKDNDSSPTPPGRCTIGRIPAPPLISTL